MSIQRQADVERIEKNLPKMADDFAAIAKRFVGYERDLFIMLEEDMTIPDVISDYLKSIHFYTKKIVEPEQRKKAAELKKIIESHQISVVCPKCKEDSKITDIEFEDFGDALDPDGLETWGIYATCENQSCSITTFHAYIQVIVNRKENQDK